MLNASNVNRSHKTYVPVPSGLFPFQPTKQECTFRRGYVYFVKNVSTKDHLDLSPRHRRSRRVVVVGR